MQLPITPHGTRELILFAGGTLLLGVAALLVLHPLAAILPWLATLFIFSFFRDPERRVEGGPEAAVAPADGKVTDIGVVEEPEVMKGKALRIGIFLSVFNVHVNRAPLDGRVTSIRYHPGRFLDARDERCKELNEANMVGFMGPRGPFAVRQVAGLIARRIICPLQAGQEVTRGERMGMIKFGSRTELFVPADARVKVEVEVGRKVRGARTVLLRYE
ncbi:MAG: phosphatidylserine decarboxylase family protein [Planctomycetota bacterium]|jgi:phosphatidylserine decarboxylase